MAEAAVEFLLDQLSAVIREEWSLLGGIREDAQHIMNALSRLKAALRVADEREEMDPQVKAWVKIVRELAYDTEDVLDEFLFRFGGRHTGGGLFTKMKNKYNSAKNLRAQHRLALALQKIKARISENSQYQPILPTTTVHNQQLYGRWDTGIPEESDLVGFENSKQSLIKLLLGAVDDDLRVHSVVGMGGLGKTTLVKKAYDDTQIIRHFQHRVWITVSETFKIEELLKDAIKQLVKQTNQQLPQDFETMGFTQLKDFNKDWSDEKCRRLIIHGFDDDILNSTSSIIITILDLGHATCRILLDFQAHPMREHGLGGFGAIVVNRHDLCVAAKAGIINCCLDPYYAELIKAIKEALSFLGSRWRIGAAHPSYLTAGIHAPEATAARGNGNI
nr:disease resistance protein RPM1-like isoform X2 [Ipomoea trifida]